jgi:protein XagA
MSLLKTLTKTLLFTLILFITSQNVSFADGGFPVRPGRLLISPSVSYFFANSQWDSTGTKKHFANNGRYSSVGVTLYAEYGLSRRFAVVASLPYVFNQYTQNTAPTSTASSGLTDLETGLRYYLANIDFIYYISIQGTAITPLYSNNASLGYGEEGADLRLAVSGTGHLFGRPSYFNVSDGIRQYFGTNGPIQNRYNGTYGLTLDDDFMNQISVGVSGINSYSDDKRFSPILETNKDFSFVQASLSYGHSFTHEISVFASAGQFLTGRNTGDGTTFSLAFIYRLDYR